MLRTHRNAAVGALVMLALVTASHQVAAQDTSRAGQAPPDTSAYTGGLSRDTTDSTLRTGVEQFDTTARPGPGAGMGDTSATADTSTLRPIQPSAGDSTDSTRAGQEQSLDPTAKSGTSSDST